MTSNFVNNAQNRLLKEIEVYGEFAQVLNPQRPLNRMPMLTDHVKNEVKSMYLEVLLDANLVGFDHLGCLVEVLRRFICPDQEGHHSWATTEQERAARWSRAS